MSLEEINVTISSGSVNVLPEKFCQWQLEERIPRSYATQMHPVLR